MRNNILKKKNKKGWIEVLEAFIAIVFLLGVVFTIIGNDKFKKQEPSTFEEKEYNILLQIQTNEELRQEIVTENNFLIDSNDTGFPPKLKSFLDSNKISGTICFTKICNAMEDCIIDREMDGNIFTAEILITNSISTYSPRKVKMFCMDL